MERYLGALGLTGAPLTAPTKEETYGALIVVRVPPPSSELWDTVSQWRAWLKQFCVCPLEEFNTLARRWGPPAVSVHTYGWIIDAEARFQRALTAAELGDLSGFAYAQRTAAAAATWRNAAPQLEVLAHQVVGKELEVTDAVPHYHPIDGHSRFRAASKIAPGTPIKVSTPYAYDVRDKRKANVVDGVTTSPISKGQPLIAKPPQNAPKRLRFTAPQEALSSIVVEANLSVSGSPVFKAVACADKRIRVMVVAPREGFVVVPVPTGAPAITADSPQPYVFLKGNLSMAVVKSKDIGRGSRLWVAPDGLFDEPPLECRAKDFKKNHTAAHARWKEHGPWIPPPADTFVVYPDTQFPALLTSFVEPSPTAMQCRDVVLATIGRDRRTNEIVMRIPTDRKGIIYCVDAISLQNDVLRASTAKRVPARLRIAHSNYADHPETQVCDMPNETAEALMRNDGPLILAAHLCHRSPSHTRALPFCAGSTVELTAMCPQLLNVAQQLLDVALNAWPGASQAINSVRLDLDADGKATLPHKRARELKLASTTDVTARFVILGYYLSADAKIPGAEAFGWCDRTKSHHRVAVPEKAEPLWPVYAARF